MFAWHSLTGFPALRVSLSSFSLFVGGGAFARLFPHPSHLSHTPRGVHFGLFPRWRSLFAFAALGVVCGWPVRLVVWPGFRGLSRVDLFLGVPPFVGWPGLPARSFRLSGGR